MQEIRRVCVTHTVYTLLQYLLLSSIEEIRHTFFFFAQFPPAYQEKLKTIFPNSTVYDFGRGKIIKSKYLQGYWWPFRKNRVWPFLKTAEIFAQDHLLVDFIILSGLQYKLLDDGMVIYSYKPETVSLKKRLKRLPFYPNGHYVWGYGPNCLLRYLTMKPHPDSPLLGKNNEYLDLIKLWQTSEPEKKEFILNFFSVETTDLEIFGRYENLLLTQCFSEIEMISEDAKMSCYRRIIEHYGLKPENTLIKTHPKETSDYRKYFPGFAVCSKPIPVELIAMQANPPRRVFTVSSSGTFIFQQSEKVWCGHEFSPELKVRYGECPSPF